MIKEIIREMMTEEHIETLSNTEKSILRIICIFLAIGFMYEIYNDPSLFRRLLHDDD